MIFEMINSKEISITKARSILDVSRSGYYSKITNGNLVETDCHVRKTIEKISLDFPRYGYRRITKEMHRTGQKTNHKKVLRIMQEEGLLCKPKKKFRITTTDSDHNYRIYPNLAKNIELTAVNQLWVADITYVRMLHESVYLAVILDVFSRKCIGWCLSRNIDTQLTINALNMAVAKRNCDDFSEIIHHSDRGVQYASDDYIDLLNELGIKIGMSRKGNPYDNAFAESFMKTLKTEEVYLKEYRTFDEAHNNIKKFIEVVYNKKRLHSGIGYMSPEEYETESLKTT